jgi:molybdopterin/thiamine biosynthesis adenylyltransferase/proteasome lid subunit RPN8/RPN11
VNATLAMTEELWREIANALDLEVESAGFLIAGVAESPDELTLLCRSVYWIPDAHYRVRERLALEIESEGYVPALKQARDDESYAVFFHTHPGGDPSRSRRDEQVDAELAPVVRLRTGRGYISTIFGGRSSVPRFSGRGEAASEGLIQLDRLRIVGSRLRLLGAPEAATPDSHAFDRQIRVFGTAGQQLLRNLHVGVVGAGGTGSTVCELLLRLGVGRLSVIDDDQVSLTNLTRIHQADRSDVGRAKVDVAADLAAALGFDTSVSAIRGRVTDKSLARALRHCDVIFGCTDDNRGRAILSRLAYWYLLPVIDTAFVVDVQGEAVAGLFGRVTTVRPGAACLICRRRVDPQMISAEALPSGERQRLAEEGYVPGLGEPDPSVGAYTTLTGSLAVAEFLDMVFGLGQQTPPTELILRLQDYALNRIAGNSQPRHYCVDPAALGRGDEEPFLDQLWT